MIGVEAEDVGQNRIVKDCKQSWIDNEKSWMENRMENMLSITGREVDQEMSTNTSSPD